MNDPYNIASMYGIFTYIYHTSYPSLGKYTSPIHGMGIAYGIRPDFPTPFYAAEFFSQAPVTGIWRFP